MSSLVERLDRAWYPTFQGNWDDELFRTRILNRLRSDAIILDLGAGAGIVPHMNFRGMVARVCGVDIDPRVIANPMLDEGRIANALGIPYKSNSFDVVFSDNVLEHLDDPLQVFREAARVLKPGGAFLFKTPNKWHYMPVIARLTPHAFHEFVNKRRGRDVVDTFPTLYRANTRFDIELIAAEAGLIVESIEHIEGRPEYLRMTWPTYLLGAGYERLVNLSELFATLRILLIGALRKPK